MKKTPPLRNYPNRQKYQDKTDQRKYPRLSLNRLVSVTIDDGSTSRQVAVNYSNTGMALNSTVQLLSGEFVELKFRLTDQDPFAPGIYDLTAEVIQTLKLGSFYKTGLKFVGTLY